MSASPGRITTCLARPSSSDSPSTSTTTSSSDLDLDLDPDPDSDFSGDFDDNLNYGLDGRQVQAYGDGMAVSTLTRCWGTVMTVVPSGTSSVLVVRLCPLKAPADVKHEWTMCGVGMPTLTRCWGRL